MAAPSSISRSALDELIAELARRGYSVIGPTVRDRAILYEEISSTADLPEGLTDEQEGGTYRLVEREDRSLFAYNVGPNSWKSHLFPSKLTLWKGRRDQDGKIDFKPEEREVPRYAFIGVRSCDLAAIGVQDRVFIGNGYTSTPTTRRAGVMPSSSPSTARKAGNTCFCVSMDTGPKASERIRPGADRAARRRWPPLPGGGRKRGGRRAARTIDSGAASEADRGRAEEVVDAVRLADGPRARHRRASRSCSIATWSTPAGTRSRSAA